MYHSLGCRISRHGSTEILDGEVGVLGILGVAGRLPLVDIRVLRGALYQAILRVGKGWLEPYVGPVNCRVGIREKDWVRFRGC